MLDSYLESAKRDKAPQWVLDAYSGMFDESMKAYWSGKELTAPIPSCPGPGASGFEQTSASGLLQTDSCTYRRVLWFGYRDLRKHSSGQPACAAGWRKDRGRRRICRFHRDWSLCGGDVIAYKVSGRAPNRNFCTGYPSTRYIENIGVHPDVHLPYMTRDNLNAKAGDLLELVPRIALPAHTRLRRQLQARVWSMILACDSSQFIQGQRSRISAKGVQRGSG